MAYMRSFVTRRGMYKPVAVHVTSRACSELAMGLSLEESAPPSVSLVIIVVMSIHVLNLCSNVCHGSRVYPG
jgi:hypothetical protein